MALSAAVSSVSVTRAAIPAWTVNVVAGKRYRLAVLGMYQAAALTTGGSIGFAGTAVGTLVGRAWGAVSQAAAATDLSVGLTALTSSLTTTGVAVVNSPHFIGLDAVLVCTTSGTLAISWGTEVAASAAQINAGSVLTVVELP